MTSLRPRRLCGEISILDKSDNFHKFISNIDEQYSCDILAMNIYQERILGDGEGCRPGDEKDREISYICRNRL